MDLGEAVAKGAALARIWPADRSGVAPAVHTAQRTGVLAARHFPGLIQTGDCLAVIATAGDGAGPRPGLPVRAGRC